MAPSGNLVRLHPLHISELPTQPELENQINPPNNKSAVDSATNGSTSRPPLLLFITEILNEAKVFVDTTLPATFKSKGLKTSPPSTAKVELLTREVSAEEIQSISWLSAQVPRHHSGKENAKPAEAWFARRSTHANDSQEGTATYSEFDEGLRTDHSVHEMEYTPDVFDAYKVLDWEEEIVAAIAGGGGELEEYKDVNMTVHEMAHALPTPLQPRVFPVLILTAKTSLHAFIVVQVPIDITALATSLYSNGRNVHSATDFQKRKKPVLGAYTSIERVSMLPDRNIEWTMATASDARGSLPMWAQKMGVPGAVVKDVGLFMKWVGGRRKVAE